MYKDHMTLMHELSGYASPRARLTRMIRKGEVIRIKRGIFLDPLDHEYSLKSLSSIIYGPSYISFEYALAHYGLIPEKVRAVTCASYNKNKNRSFHTPVGDFYYYYLPAAVYPYGITQGSESGQSFLMASPEKALCDALYRTRGITTIEALSDLLIEDWRMEEEDLAGLDRKAIDFLAPLYNRNIIQLLLQWFESGPGHE